MGNKKVSTTDILERRAAVVPSGYVKLNDLVVVSGQGSRLNSADGRSFLDFASGIGTVNVGHCPESVVKAVQEQSERLLHACFHVATYEPYVELCERLVKLFPHGDRTKAMLVNSGAEAVENAVKIARHATGRSGIICFTEGFHGRTLLGLTLTSKTGYKKGAGPYAPEIYRLPFPNYYRDNDGLSPEVFVARALRKVEEAFINLVPADQVSAILIEVVQGEGGFVPAPSGYLKGLREICDRTGILLIVDEVQTGFCRTGRWAAFEHHGIVPDISTWAKSMGGGMPISAVVGKAEIMDAPPPGTLGGTFGGNPVACASALATIELMEKQDLNKRAMEIGEQIRYSFEAIAESSNMVGDVRGLGAMMAMEFVEGGDPARPASDFTSKIIKGCYDEGLLVIPAGSYSNVLRVLSPLVISDEDLGRGLKVIEKQVQKDSGGS